MTATTAWTSDELTRIGATLELELAARPTWRGDLESFAAHGLHGIPEDRLHVSDFYEHSRSDAQQIGLFPQAQRRGCECMLEAGVQTVLGTPFKALDNRV